jgi:hypothetical protein
MGIFTTIGLVGKLRQHCIDRINGLNLLFAQTTVSYEIEVLLE